MSACADERAVGAGRGAHASMNNERSEAASFCRRLAPGGMPFERWTNCSLGFDISIPRFVRDKTAVVKQAGQTLQLFPGNGADVQRPCEQVALLRLGDPASVIAQLRRTIERRLIPSVTFG